MITSKAAFPVNTLDDALRLARILSRDLTSGEANACRSFRVFSALASDEREALAAFYIWRGRGEAFRELAHRE